MQWMSTFDIQRTKEKSECKCRHKLNKCVFARVCVYLCVWLQVASLRCSVLAVIDLWPLRDEEWKTDAAAIVCIFILLWGHLVVPHSGLFEGQDLPLGLRLQIGLVFKQLYNLLTGDEDSYHHCEYNTRLPEDEVITNYTVLQKETNPNWCPNCV